MNPNSLLLSITKSIDHLLVISTHIFSSIIMITSLLNTSVRIKHWNQFTMDIPGPVSILIYNNSTSLVSLVYNLSVIYQAHLVSYSRVILLSVFHH